MIPTLILRNCRLLNVHSGEIYATDITIDGDTIRSTEPVDDPRADRVFEGGGMFAVPGLIDAHMHVDTTFLWPGELARAIVPLGTTTVFVDTTNIAHTGGPAPIRCLMDSFAGLPLKGQFAAPSYCPLDPSLETAAMELRSADIAGLLDAGCVSIGETVWSKINLGHDDFFRGIQLCRERGGRVSGHGGEIAHADEAAFDGYVAAGLQDDHCLRQEEDVRPRLRRGLRLFCVETPGRLGQLKRIMGEAQAHRLPLRHFCLCVDNITVMDLIGAGFGYQDHLVRLALGWGIPPAEVYRMATLNPAEHYRQSDRLGSIAPGRAADILLLSALDAFPPEWVIADGKFVAHRGQLTVEVPPPRFPDFYRHTIDLSRVARSALDVRVEPARTQARVRMIRARDGEAFNTGLEVDLPVSGGKVRPDLGRDILCMATVERYGRNGNVGRGFVTGFGLKRGAVATSLSVPSNNLVAVGVSEDDLWQAIHHLEQIQGGFVVVADGQVLAQVRFPLGGIMAEQPFEEVVSEIAAAHAVARSLGCTLQNPFFTMAQTVLSTLPDFGLTDRGLVSSQLGRTVPTVVEGGIA